MAKKEKKEKKSKSKSKEGAPIELLYLCYCIICRSSSFEILFYYHEINNTFLLKKDLLIEVRLISINCFGKLCNETKLYNNIL